MPTQQINTDQILGSIAGSAIQAVQTKRTSGSITVNTTGWQDVDNGLDLTLTGVTAGQKIEVGMSAFVAAVANSVAFDVATIVSGSPVNYVGTTGAIGDFGVMAWFCDNADSEPGGSVIYTLAAGDIVGGNVTLRLRCRPATTTARSISATTAIPLHFWAKLLGSAAIAGSGVGMALIAVKEYDPGTMTNPTTTSGTFVDVDATNLVVSFVAPADGTVIVRLTAVCTIGVATAALYWNLRDTGGNVAGTAGIVTSTAALNRQTYDVYLTGLTPGVTYTYKWGWSTSGGNTGTMSYGGVQGPASMFVYGAASAGSYRAEVIGVALSDEVTAITTGTAKATMRMPFAMTLTGVRASLTTASSSGIPTVNIKENGTTIFSTKLTIDATELTSTTALIPAVLSDVSLADDAEITFDIDVAGTGAKGLKVWLIGVRA